MTADEDEDVVTFVATHPALRDLIWQLVDEDDPCSFDHHGGCQAHGYLSLESGEVCPQEEAKRLIILASGVAAGVVVVVVACAKCGSTDAAWAYHEAGQMYGYANCVPLREQYSGYVTVAEQRAAREITEHLCLTCGRCGYQWQREVDHAASVRPDGADPVT